jgi:hypothetical protein
LLSQKSRQAIPLKRQGRTRESSEKINVRLRL